MYEQLTRDQERDLIQKWHANQCERSRRALYDAFYPLIAKHARKRRDIDMDDAIQIASMGFIKALDTFDLDNGAKFATHLIWQIRGFMSETSGARYIRNKCQEYPTLDAPMTGSDGETHKDMLVEPSKPDYDWHRVANSLSDAMADMPDRERVVLMGRANDLTLNTLARHYGVTRERIRQIEAKALDKMRKRVDKGLRYYLEDVG